MRRVSLHAACTFPLFFAAFVGLGYPAENQGAGDLHFSAVREGGVISVSASIELPADPALAWVVLTDYDHYADFISGLSESKVVARNVDGVVIEQKGAIGVMLFRQPVQTRMVVTESPPTSVVSRGMDGDFRNLTGRYELQPAGSGVRLAYSGSFVPDFFIPPFIGMAIVRHTLERNFSELAAEIVRRAGNRK